MTTLSWVGLGVYACTAVYGFRVTLREFIEHGFVIDDGLSCPNPADWGNALGTVLFAALIGLIGGSLITFWQAFKLATRGRDAEAFARALAGESREHKVARLERERLARERYISELEKEVEISR